MPLFFGELAAQALDEDLLIDGVNVEDQDQGNQTKNSVSHLQRDKSFQILMQCGEGERDNRKRKEKHHQDGISPKPPIALFDLTELLRQLFIASFNRSGHGRMLGVSHVLGAKGSGSLHLT